MIELHRARSQVECKVAIACLICIARGKNTRVTIDQGKFCVFCGKPPDGKTREHVVPYWLLEMTGDPTRVVAFGLDFARSQKPIRYSCTVTLPAQSNPPTRSDN